MLADDIDEQKKAGRRSVNKEPEAEVLESDTRQMPSAGVMLGVGMAIIGLGVLGWMIYRRRQESRSLVQQLAGRIPVALDDVRDELQAQLKRVKLDDVRDELRTQLNRVRSR